MKPYTAVFIFLLTIAGVTAKAQMTMHKLVHIGYVYQNQSFGEIGGRLLFLNNDDVIFRVGAAAMMGSSNSKFAVLPKIQGDFLINFERNVDFYHSYYLLAGAEATTKYLAPKVGVNLLGMLDLAAGYAFPIDKNGVNGKELKGLNISLTLNVPTVLIHDLVK